MTTNLIVILSDEHQARAMGCAGHAFVKTPHLDKLAARGRRFTQAYTPSPICVPARASFATGRYAHQNRLWDNAMPYTGSIPGWGHRLQEHNIPVESIGKLHYRSIEDSAGFDHEHIPMMVAGGVGMVWASIRREDERVTGPRRMLGEYIGPGSSDYTRYDEAVVQHTNRYLHNKAKTKDQAPWCLYVGLVAPHFPLVVPQEFYDLYPHDLLPEVKLHPDNSHPRHPWVEKQNAFMDSESKFKDAKERLSAMASYYGLCSWLDNNVGSILNTLDATGLSNNTTVIYSSDHGDNVGARGLWGKSNMYEESAAIPLIMAGPEIPPGVCDTPVSLIDLSQTITAHFDTGALNDAPGQSLYELPDNHDAQRVVFSEYHAAGAVSGAFMIRQGYWKYIYYVGFEPELFDLDNDPQELHNLAGQPAHHAKQQHLHNLLTNICDPYKVDAQAHTDQAKLIQHYGGREKALTLGAPAATPPPST